MKKILFFLLLSAVLLSAENWAQFLGPNGAGISAEKGLPVKWTVKDYKWKVKLPGIGHSSPIVWEDRVIVTSAANKGEKRFVECYDADTGKPVWSEELGGERTRLAQAEGMRQPHQVQLDCKDTDGQALPCFLGKKCTHPSPD